MKLKIPAYTIFKEEIFKKLTSKRKNALFCWSLLDTSSWEEIPPKYYPDYKNGHKKVIEIMKMGKSIKELVDEDMNYFIRRFVNGEFLSNFLLAAELENQLDSSWRLDLDNLQQAVFPDVLFISKSNSRKVNIEVKGVISASNLKNRIEDEVIPHLRDENYKEFVLLLLFPVCPGENPNRVNQLIEGYYIYETVMNKGGQKVLCQCIKQDADGDRKAFSLEKLVGRLIAGYFSKA
ncbi:hypothetical protein A2982_00645 [candidate division WWE3 bacterium RIFCSPLOWO2_01_FULL_39_13]|uniref:Restriction endonuclease n=1 Tax=candidate division WWE3 bacterium RIFCSPLOWO2_01_FULL_39_13 TaxID=1802624 RepID=A0A1F4V3J8_UNCKA|nr:MAG: hypothetical protein A2982_00645 [candidate division WWE3 bacterium RIFCSPLOWO2_01_FULL_39_13]